MPNPFIVMSPCPSWTQYETAGFSIGAAGKALCSAGIRLLAGISDVGGCKKWLRIPGLGDAALFLPRIGDDGIFGGIVSWMFSSMKRSGLRVLQV
ncbi:hypothetical protein [Nevskia soli]|uniref:hypothetical protein n=1 Tax=Nevskia soli TaxID=418856 RepID=UPI0012F8D14F|nr:hypothetical protein [Nevskia soli]